MKPIIFSTEMVKAILDGRKTQTRRVIKPQPLSGLHNGKYRYDGIQDGVHALELLDDGGNPTEKYYACVKPPYVPGDVLWVRETWCYLYDLDGNDQIIEGTGKYYYAADKELPPYSFYLRDDGTHRDFPIWKPSIHMSKAAARIFLKVTDVSVERLQEISSRDCFREGIKVTVHNALPPVIGNKFTLAHFDFAELWDSINAKHHYSWKNNPWVWSIKFERTEKP